MKSNAYLRFSIAIFPVNVSWQYKLFKRYRFGVFTKTEHIFAHDDFSKTKYCPLHQETPIYNFQTAIPWFNVDISRKNKSVELNNLVASCRQAVDKFSTSWEQAVRTHPVDKLLEQHCYKSAAGLLQLVRFTCVKTRKNAQVVTSLPTSRQQDVLALLVTSCQQVCNNLLTTCNNLVEIIRLVARLFRQVRDMLDITRLLQPCVDNLVTSLLYHGCNKLVSTIL
jgi:hypothetical protein